MEDAMLELGAQQLPDDVGHGALLALRDVIKRVKQHGLDANGRQLAATAGAVRHVSGPRQSARGRGRRGLR